MNLAIENEDGSFKEKIITTGNIEWDNIHYCSASALTLAERKIFRVVDFAETQPPATPRWKQTQEIDPIKVDGVWTQQWEIVSIFHEFTDEQGVHTVDEQERAATAKQDLKAIADKESQLWTAADAYATGQISGVAIGILAIGVMQQKPKALAISAWSKSLWDEYYIRKAAITATSALDLDFSMFGEMPYSVHELTAEVGL